MILRSLFYSCERNTNKNPPFLATQQSTYYMPVITTAFLKSDGKLQKLIRNWTDI